MWKPRALPGALALLLLHSLLLVSAQRSEWKTLNGSPPKVIARGGFSGLFPDSSELGYKVALDTSVKGAILWCDVQLTKDAVGLCLPDMNLQNSTYITSYFKNSSKTYLVNGKSTTGSFSIDFTFKDISEVILTQGVYSRTNRFDGRSFLILRVDDIPPAVNQTNPLLWLNIQHDQFYTQHNLSMRSYVLSVARRVPISYISSPEVGFLRSITSRFNPKTTKLIYRFLEEDTIDPSVNQTYGSLKKNLTFIKTFASGILVPKGYIWPVDASLYLQPHTSLVSDAHKVGLEVFASDFVNDVPFSFNYSYDPVAEYLQFIDNGDFSVDGVLSDFPITPSAAVDCFAHLGPNATKTDKKTLVISKYGASGDYPPCTDLAYKQAILDGVDVLDCPVQMSRGGTPFCLSSIDLIESTNVARSSFSKNSIAIPEIQSDPGIFTFDLSWDDIKSLSPQILNPYAKYRLFRNPKFKSSGTFLTLSDFLSLTKNQTSLSGVMIIVENAAYLADKQGLSVTDAVIDALSKAGYDKPGAQKVFIQSTNSSVLQKFKEKTKYERVYKVDETIGDAAIAAVEDIKSFAGSVVVNKESVYPLSLGFATGATRTISKLKASNLSVFVETFSNEFVSQGWDFFSDATVEINTYIQAAEINGVITDFPKTADRYRRNKCLNFKNIPSYMEPVSPGDLLTIITTDSLPPAQAPLPPLTESEVTEAPLPPVVAKIAPASSPGAGTKLPPGNAQPKVTVCFFFSSLAVFVASLLLL